MPHRATFGIAIATTLVACSPPVHDASSLAVAVGARYGATATRWDNHPDHVTLGLTLTDPRWTRLGPGADLPDSARSVARYTLGEIDKVPGLARPDSITVTIQTVNRGLLVFRETGSSGFAFASKDL